MDELLAFCREAPPEFNNHQRDVFCVFSGNGVGRLREFLNQRAARAASQAENGTDNTSEMGDVDDTESGVNSPLMQLNVQGNHPPGATPVIPMPTQNGGTPQHFTWSQVAGQHHLSQSAPASAPAFWNFGAAPAGLGLANQGGAQQVTGMMGAAILDDVDEGDEAFGEGSEIMGD